MEESIIQRKFWFIQHLEDLLLSAGVSQSTSNIITYVIACLIIILIIWITDMFGSKIMLYLAKKLTRWYKAKWEQYLYKRRFFHKVVRIIPTALALYFSGIILQGYDANVVDFTKFLLQCVIVVMSISIISSVLDMVNDIYEGKSDNKSIKGYMQTIKIILWVVALIALFSTLMNIKPIDLIVALGATAAIISIVFRDIILSFVASIQLSVQDMIRKGDRISMPTRNADGEIEDITLTTVKVKNWDNTETMIPIYAMISESFTNWRMLQKSTGRRFMKYILIDTYSVEVLEDAGIDEIASHPHVSPLAGQMKELFKSYNTSPFATNIGLFRSYMEAYIKSHGNIGDDPKTIVRYLQQEDNGIKLEIYSFTKEIFFQPYEKTIADILEHAMGIAPVFGLKLFQAPSGQDIRKIKV